MLVLSKCANTREGDAAKPFFDFQGVFSHLLVSCQQTRRASEWLVGATNVLGQRSAIVHVVFIADFVVGERSSVVHAAFILDFSDKRSAVARAAFIVAA